MKKNEGKLLTVGELAKKVGVTVRTLQYYDTNGLLVPTGYSEGGRRMYGMHDAIRELKAAGVTILLATHDMAEAESLCDRIAIIIQGRIAVIGTPAEITSAGHSETRITLRTKENSLLPGRDIGDAHFLRQTEGYGVWLSRDTAVSVMEILKAVQQSGDTVEDLRVERPTLEERFLELVEGGIQ